MPYTGQQHFAHKIGIDLVHAVIQALHEGQGRVGTAADEETGLMDRLADPGRRQIPIEVAAAIMSKRCSKAPLFILADIFLKRRSR